MTPANKNLLHWFLHILLLLTGLQCSTPSLTGGSGTEVSAVVGIVINNEGQPVEKALVRLRPTSFINDSTKSASYLATHSIRDTVTSRDGSFRFTKVFPDNYSIEILYNDTLGSVKQVFIEDSTSSDTLSAITVVPLAKLSGNVNLPYSSSSLVIIQAYGIDRFVTADAKGDFSLMIPDGSRKFHIAAYRNDDSTRRLEFDGIDISLNLLPGEQRNAGSFQLRQPPSRPCKDGTCDSMVIHAILDLSGNNSTPLTSVITTNVEGRVVELNLRGLNFPKGINFDIIRLSELQILDIGSTNLSVMFPDIGTMVNLEVVRVDHNKLPFFSSTVGNLSKLKVLDLNNNDLTELPQSIINCQNLSKINVSGNRLCSLDSTMSAWIETLVPEWPINQRCQ